MNDAMYMLQVRMTLRGRNSKQIWMRDSWTITAKWKRVEKEVQNFTLMNMCQLKLIQWTKFHPLHPNVIIGKITEVENDYAKIVTKFGRLKTYISTNRLNKCTATNIQLDFSTEITWFMQTPCHFSPPLMIEFRSIRRCQWLSPDKSIGEFSIVYKKWVLCYGLRSIIEISACK